MTMMTFVLLFAPSVTKAGADGDAKKAYEAGDFNRAVTILIEKLRKKNDHQDNIALMETVLPFAFKKAMSQANDYSARGDWDNAFQAYTEIRALADEVSFLPPVMKEVKIDGKKQKQPVTFDVVDVTSELNNARTMAIQKHYDDGVAAQDAGSWKTAAKSFRAVKEYDPTFKDAVGRYDECRDKAIFKVAIMPFDDMSGKSQFGNLGQLITEQVISSAMNSNPEFLRFVTRDYLNQLIAEQGLQQTTTVDPTTATLLGQKIGVQAFVFGKVLSVIPNFPADIEKAGDNTAEIYVAKNQKQAIYARYIMHTRSGSVTIQASYQIIDVEQGNIVSAENMQESADDIATWVTYDGDERAIPQNVLAHQIPPGERPLSPPEMLANDCANKIASMLAGRLVSRFE